MKKLTLTTITVICFTVSFAQTGDDCSDPITLSGASGNIGYTTTGLNNNHTSNSSNGTGEEIVYALNTAVPQGDTLKFWTTGDDYNVVLYARYLSCTKTISNEIAFLNDPDGDVLTWVNPTAGSQYVWLFADGYNGSDGSATLHWYISITTGVEELAAADYINVYPNPNTGKFILEMEISEPSYLKIKLLNIMGQTVYEESLNANSPALPSQAGIYKKTIHAGNSATGIYTLQLISDKGTTNKKVIVE